MITVEAGAGGGGFVVTTGLFCCCCCCWEEVRVAGVDLKVFVVDRVGLVEDGWPGSLLVVLIDEMVIGLEPFCNLVRLVKVRTLAALERFDP